MADIHGNGGDAASRRDVVRNRELLIAAAQQLLSQHPQTSMAAISQAAGLGRNTIYRHFASRQALISALRERSSDGSSAVDSDHLRPAGELANVSPTPMSIWDVLNKVAPFQLGLQIVAEAQRLPGVTAAAVYLVDLDGRTLQRFAGPENFPQQIEIELAVGPEIDRLALPLLRAAVERAVPTASVAPMDLRGRATGVLLAVGGLPQGLRELAQEAAAALTIAEQFTDLPGRVRRSMGPLTPAAELQQSVLPPRIVRIGGAMLAANLLPSQKGFGDWFDYTDNPDQAWLGILDMQGSGLRSTTIAAAVLAAFRAARHRDGATPARAVHLMHSTLLELAERPPTAAATVATWNSATTVLQWVVCGDTAPLLVDVDGSVRVLGEREQPRLGADDFPKQLRVQSHRVKPGERVLFVSDGVTARTNADDQLFGIDGITRSLTTAGMTAPATLRAIQDAALAHASGPLTDDATIMVLAPTPSAH